MIDLDNLSPENTRKFNKAIPSASLKYNILISNLSNYFPEDVSWQLSSIISRHPSLTQIHRRCCQLYFLKSIIKDFKKPVLFSVNNKTLSGIINQYFKNNNINHISKKNENQIELIKRKIKPFKNAIIILFHAFSEYLFSRVSKLYLHNKNNFESEITILDTFVIPSSFSNNNSTYIDRYYTGALTNLNEKDRKHFFYLPTFVGLSLKQYMKYFINIRKESNLFILKEDYLQFSDYFFAFIEMAKLKSKLNIFLNVAFMFEGFNISQYLHNEMATSFINEQTYRGILNYKFVQRLKESKLKLRMMIDWNENQVGDRGLIKGFHDYLPKVKTVGYQGFIVDYDFHVYLKPTSNEMEKGYIPQKYCVIGKALSSKVKEYCQQLEVNVAPAFRYRHIWDFEIQKNDSRNIIISLPIEKNIAFKMIAFIHEALKENIYKHKIFIKPHPIHNTTKIKKYCNQVFNSSKFEIINEPFDQILKTAGVIITSYSSTAIESLMCGIPTIVISGFDIFDHKPIPNEVKEDFLFYSYEPITLIKMIQKAFTFDYLEKAIFKKRGEMIRSNYFQSCNLYYTNDFFSAT